MKSSQKTTTNSQFIEERKAKERLKGQKMDAERVELFEIARHNDFTRFVTIREEALQNQRDNASASQEVDRNLRQHINDKYAKDRTGEVGIASTSTEITRDEKGDELVRRITEVANNAKPIHLAALPMHILLNLKETHIRNTNGEIVPNKKTPKSLGAINEEFTNAVVAKYPLAQPIQMTSVTQVAKPNLLARLFSGR